jgi:hypothetical protein
MLRASGDVGVYPELVVVMAEGERGMDALAALAEPRCCASAAAALREKKSVMACIGMAGFMVGDRVYGFG